MKLKVIFDGVRRSAAAVCIGSLLVSSASASAALNFTSLPFNDSYMTVINPCDEVYMTCIIIITFCQVMQLFIKFQRWIVKHD